MPEMTEEKVDKLVAREVKRAVAADRKRILGELKELKAELADNEDKAVVRVQNKLIATANKIVRDTNNPV